MRLLHVHSGNLYGGVETLLVTLARFRHLAPLEHEVALCFEGRIATELAAEGIEVHRLGAARVRHPLTVRRSRRALREVLRRSSFDGVVVHSAWAMALFGRVIKRAGQPLVYWLHGPSTGRHWLELWARTIEPHLILCNSLHTARTAGRLYPRKPPEVVYPPVATEGLRIHAARCSATRRELGTADRAIVIVQASRLEALKGYCVLLEALALLKDVPDWRCWLIGGVQRAGERRYLKRLKAAAVQHGIADRVLFCGERRDTARLLAAADIYCQPNIGPEGFGIALVEALGAGLPVLTTGLGGVAEVIDDSCGICIAANDPGALAEAIRVLIEDPLRRAQMGAAAVRRAARLCDPARQITQLALILGALSRISANIGVTATAAGARP